MSLSLCCCLIIVNVWPVTGKNEREPTVHVCSDLNAGRLNVAHLKVVLQEKYSIFCSLASLEGDRCSYASHYLPPNNLTKLLLLYFLMV
ncbi:hypothetical protein O6H91_02G083600 [Diphasiastrum complanatum]|uniref:Uncharacterized protein n=1 Tax=Diphasiastrum complanatum TaxID=34168 RepID=A0ACC2EHE8_DIPCM|nr:hypothetical protein O6H91_02G083600 [Diphasiastrum complanatum]